MCVEKFTLLYLTLGSIAPRYLQPWFAYRTTHGTEPTLGSILWRYGTRLAVLEAEDVFLSPNQPSVGQRTPLYSAVCRCIHCLRLSCTHAVP